jgi:hypothetical protein|tara:strand:+ start:410 stop:688 length:279 start_codon:yes stop_codon:yes gene_type:complete
VKNILSEITITIEGVKIKRDCTVGVNENGGIETFLVHPGYAKSKLAYEDISDSIFEVMSSTDHRMLHRAFERLISMEVEEDTDPRANVEVTA